MQDLLKDELGTILCLLEDKIEVPPKCAGKKEEKCKGCGLNSEKGNTCLYHSSRALHKKIESYIREF